MEGKRANGNDRVDGTVAALLCFGLAGVAFVAAGDLLLALGMLLNGVSMVRGGDSTLFVGLLTAGGSAVLAAIGVDYFRGGMHLDTAVVE